jgi:hypothetical protein
VVLRPRVVVVEDYPVYELSMHTAVHTTARASGHASVSDRALALDRASASTIAGVGKISDRRDPCLKPSAQAGGFCIGAE